MNDEQNEIALRQCEKDRANEHTNLPDGEETQEDNN